MKKIYALLPMFVFVSVLMIGQPTLTYEGNAPQIGDVFYQSYSEDFVNPGPQGPNKTWNFSGLSTYETGELHAIDPESTPFADIFTEANIAFNYSGNRSATYNFSKITSTEANNLGMGFDETPPMIIYYDEYAKLMEYPCSFNDNFTDSYSGGYEMEGMLVTQSGTIEKTADAWGTITTPAGTFENVLRLKTTRNEIDSTWMDDIFLWRTVTLFNDYEWYTSDSKVPVFAITITSSAVVNDTISYFTTGMTNINNFKTQQGRLLVFPNPAGDFIRLLYSPLESDKFIFSLVDLTGRELMKEEMTSSLALNQEYRIDLKGISPGIYFVKVGDGNLSISKKLLIR